MTDPFDPIALAAQYGATPAEPATPPVAPPAASASDAELEAFILKHEGTRLQPYLDAVGRPTVGVGHLLTNRPEDRKLAAGGQLTPERARELLREDIRAHQKFKAWVTVPLTPEQDAAITSLAFNLGPDHRGVRRVVELTNAGDLDGAAREFLRYTSARDARTGEAVRLPGLVNRRREEAELFRRGAAKHPPVGVLAPPPGAQWSAEPAPAAFDPLALAAQHGALPVEPSAPERSVGEQLAAGASLGLKKGLVPAAVTPEEYRREQTGVEAVADLLTDVGSGMAAGAAIGGTVGMVFPPAAPFTTVIGAMIYGTYAGISREVARSRAEGQEFSPLRAAGAVALEANPLLRSSGKLATVTRAGRRFDWEIPARIAAQAVGTGAHEYSYTQDPQRAAVSGATALVMAPVLWHGMRVRPGRGDVKPTEATVTAVSDMMQGDMGRDLLGAVYRAKQALPAGALTYDAQTKIPFAFRQYVTGDYVGDTARVAAKFDELASKTTPKRMNDMWELYVHERLLVDEAAKLRTRLSSEIATGQLSDPTTNAAKWLKDGKFWARAVDRVIPLDMDGALDGVSRAHDAFNVAATAHLNQANKAYRLTQRAGLDRRDVGRYLAGREDLMTANGRRLAATEAGQAALGEWRKAFTGVREQIREAGHTIGWLEKYIPMRQLDGPELSVALENRIRSLDSAAKAAGHQSFVDFHALGERAPDDYRELLDVARHILNVDTVQPKDLLSLSKAVMERSKRRIGHEASAVFTRTGEVPAWTREWDVGRLFERYTNGNLKAVYLGDALKDVRAKAQALQALGLEQSAAWTNRYLEHMSGHAGAGSAVWNGVMDEVRRAGIKLEQAGSGRLGRAAQALPDFVAWANAQAYPAFLGFNVRATLRNMTQSYFTTAPEIGGTKGYGLVWQGLVDTVQQLRRGGYDALRDDLKRAGQLADMVTAEFTGPQLGVGASKAGHVVKWVNELGMSLYSKTDVLNRAITLNVGRNWARQVLAGDRAALAALRHLGEGAKVRRVDGSTLAQLVRAGDEERLSRLLGDYLIGKTQFRYGKSQMNQFGREFGSAFSMFTKWPMMTAADMVELVQRRQVGRFAQKYLGPLAVLYGVQAMLDKADDPTLKWVLGDVTELSPTKSAFAFDALAGGPLVKAVVGTPAWLHQAGEDPGRAVRDVVRGGLKTYVPPVSSVLNEIDRYQRAHGEKRTLSRRLVNEALGGP